jgi:hypothetical protein
MWQKLLHIFRPSRVEPIAVEDQQKEPESPEDRQATEKEQWRRAVYLHEAGHVVVALDRGLIVRSAQCDSEKGGVATEIPPDVIQATKDLQQRFAGKLLTAEDFAAKGIDLYKPSLICELGGLAGESLEYGRAIVSTTRASDDLASFFRVMLGLTEKLTPELRAHLWQQVFIGCQMLAYRTVKQKERQVRRLADELESVVS